MASCHTHASCYGIFSHRIRRIHRTSCREEPPTDFTDLHRYLWCTVLPQNSQNSQNLAAWVWQGCHTLLICAHLCHLWEALLCKRFLCVPCVLWESLSSHVFLLRRVWHLAIPTPPAMGYSPTEYAEFTEPPTEMSSHGFHRFTQILRVRCSPTEFTEFTEFGSVGMAGMPYPPTSVNIRVICGRLFSARSFCEFRAFCGNLFPPTDFTDLHRYLWCAVLPQNSQNTQNLAAWVWQGCHTLLHLCASVPSVGVLSLQEVLCIRCIPWELLHRLFCWCSSCSGKRQSRAETAALPGLAAWVWQGCHTLLHLCVPCVLWESFLCKRFCVFGVFRGSFFTICFVGAAETAAPPGGIHGSSVHISPPHHLTTTTPFHLEPSLLHVLPELWVRLRYHLRLVDAQPREHNCRRGERHRHAVVVVGVDRL